MNLHIGELTYIPAGATIVNIPIDPDLTSIGMVTIAILITILAYFNLAIAFIAPRL
jgi:hypothetical protein